MMSPQSLPLVCLMHLHVKITGDVTGLISVKVFSTLHTSEGAGIRF